uniref:Cytochrome P450 n=1 Tax=Compsopogon caeruleus TaxID=31354 RepID=A0A7S1TDI9_9RHOD|mmetsp:Transcript_1907/g.3439  ORF Transcript_1907/g.3439 Transcript_1907/m.3439 type:complete len:547 (+) Transcript_1907:61-1701(+)
MTWADIMGWMNLLYSVVIIGLVGLLAPFVFGTCRAISLLLTHLWLRYSRYRHITFPSRPPESSTAEWLFEGHGLLIGVNRSHASVMDRLMRYVEEHNGPALGCLGIFFAPRIVVWDLDMIQSIFAKPDLWMKPEFVRNTLRDITGDSSVLLTEGDLHRRQRKIIGPSFHHDALRHTYSVFMDLGSTLVQRWKSMVQESLNHSVVVDLFKEVLRIPIVAICRTAFGMKEEYLRTHGKKLDAAFGKIFANLDSQSVTVRRLSILFLHIFPIWLTYRFPLKMLSDRRKAAQLIRNEVSSLIKQRSTVPTEGTPPQDLLDSLLRKMGGDAEDRNCTMSRSEVLDNCMTFMSAGSMTTVSLLTSMLTQLALHPRSASKLREEISSAFPAGLKSDDDVSKLDKLPYLDAVFRESIRLYPPIPATARIASETITVGDLTIPKGAYVLVPIAALQRLPALWGHDANLFRPERWLNSSTGGASMNLAFMPFLYGPRSCIGSRFATLEAKVVVAHIYDSDIRLTVVPACEFYQFSFVSAYVGLMMKIELCKEPSLP